MSSVAITISNHMILKEGAESVRRESFNDCGKRALTLGRRTSRSQAPALKVMIGEIDMMDDAPLTGRISGRGLL